MTHVLEKDASMFIVPAYREIPILPEARLTRDLSMPVIDWSMYDAPAWQRLKPRTFLRLPKTDKPKLFLVRKAA